MEETTVAQEVPEEYFADLISNVSHANGVFRIEFAQQHVNNEVRPVVRMLLPANQLQSMVRSIAGAANEIREKVQSQIDSRTASAPQARPAQAAQEAIGAPAARAKPTKPAPKAKTAPPKAAPKAKPAPKAKGKK